MPAADEDINATAEAQEAPVVETIAEPHIVEAPPDGEEQIELPPDADLVVEDEPLVLPDAGYPATAFVTIQLLAPFTVGRRKIKSVSIRPPMTAEVDAVVADRLSASELAARMCGLPLDVYGSLLWPDAERVLGIVISQLPQHVRTSMEA
jgi:hypothetical protein